MTFYNGQNGSNDIRGGGGYYPVHPSTLDYLTEQVRYNGQQICKLMDDVEMLKNATRTGWKPFTGTRTINTILKGPKGKNARRRAREKGLLDTGMRTGYSPRKRRPNQQSRSPRPRRRSVTPEKSRRSHTSTPKMHQSRSVTPTIIRTHSATSKKSRSRSATSKRSRSRAATPKKSRSPSCNRSTAPEIRQSFNRSAIPQKSCQSDKRHSRRSDKSRSVSETSQSRSRSI
jgi:hypothetical protein